MQHSRYRQEEPRVTIARDTHARAIQQVSD